MSRAIYHQNGLYCKGSPVYIRIVHCEVWRKEKARLHVIYQNLSSKTISEASFCAVGSETMDGEKQTLQIKLKKNHNSVECNAVGSYFYEMDGVYRIDDVFCTKVRFEDGSCWKLPEGSVWEHLPQQEYLFTHLGRTLYKQYQRDVMGIYAWFVPGEYEGLWRCACGGENSRHAVYCRRCGTKLDYVFSSMNIELLIQNYERYKKAWDSAEKHELDGIKNRYEYFQLTFDDSAEDSLEREKEIRRMIREIHYEGEKMGFTRYPDRHYSFMRKPEETDEELLSKGCMPPDEQYSFWRGPKTKDTDLLDEGYRPPDESHDRWYWPEDRIK